MLRFILGFCGFVTCLVTSATADLAGKTTGRLTVDGTQLLYDTDAAGSNLPAEIDEADLERLRTLLRRHPKVETLVLNSSGGSLWVAEEISRLILDYGLDTHVDGQCNSACVTIFLGGDTRTMERGSKMGFHQNSWSDDSMREYYKAWYGHENGWNDPFEFSEWLYVFTQTEAHDHLTHMIDRGVDPAFAIRSERPVTEFWYPSRQELVAAEVLRD